MLYKRIYISSFIFKLLILFIVFFILSSNVKAVTTYYVSTSGSDTNDGSQTNPWKTMDKAVSSLVAGDTLFIRGGIYETINDAWRFKSTGTKDYPITVRNYPNEQVIFKINTIKMEYRAFRCMYDPNSPSPRQPSPANYIKLLGSDLSVPKTLSNGVTSQKGMVVLGIEGANAVGIESIGDHCNNWEISGFDFIETGGGIFQRNGRSGNWQVHNNRVYNFYRESGMQFNGNNNTIFDNKIYLVNSLPRTYGCQMINLLGHNNIVRHNHLTRAGSTHTCYGVFFEWDLADENIIEQNLIEDVPTGIIFSGGDYNIIRNNIIISATNINNGQGIRIRSYPDSTTAWPCNESASSFSSLLPPNDPSHAEYKYYYNPRNCHSHSNKILNNTIYGFKDGVRFWTELGENTIIRNNAVINWTSSAPFCYSSGDCQVIPSGVTISNNAITAPFGMIDITKQDFRLMDNSTLINTGYNLESINSNDYNGVARPQGAGYDIGAFEYISNSFISPTFYQLTSTPIPTNTTYLTPTIIKIRGDITGPNGVSDHKVDINDFNKLVNEFDKTGSNIADINGDNKVDIFDFNILLENYNN